MRSIARGSRPSTVIAADSGRYAFTARAPKNVSPSPVSPSSVCTRTHSTFGNSSSRTVSSAVIFISRSPRFR